MDGFDFLRDAFKKFSAKVDGKDIAARAVRSAGAGGKALADRGMQEFPHSYIKDLIDSAYGLLTSQDVAEGISMTVRSFDEEKIKDVLDQVVAQLKEDKVATQLAKQLKEVLRQTSTDDMEAALEQAVANLPQMQQMVVRFAFMRARPTIDDMRSKSEAELAETIKELADTIPTDLIALQAGALTREVTPERITHQAHGLVDKLPSGSAIADIAHGVGKAASEAFDGVSKARDLKDAAASLDTFAGKMANIIAGKLSDDAQAKKTFDKKGKGGFNF